MFTLRSVFDDLLLLLHSSEFICLYYVWRSTTHFLGLFCVCFLRKYRFMGLLEIGLFTGLMGLICENRVD